MKAIDRYFTNDAKSLKIQIDIRDLNRQIRKLRKKQEIYFSRLRRDDAEVRQMFNNGVFNHYGHMTMKYFNKLFSK